MKDFSIVIPTYNRKDRLIRELKSIFLQPLSGEIYIQILDNGSEYNVQKALTEAFSETQLAHLDVISYPINIGGSLNICMPFFYCKTKWMWILSDDDEVNPDSLETIFSDIENHPNIGVFKYSYTGYIHLQYEDETYSSMEEVVGLTGKKKQTEFMLCSNAVYNMKVLEPYRGRIIQYAYNNIGAFNPICIMLDEHAGCLMTRSAVLLDYKETTPGSGWDSFKLYIECGTFFDYPFNTSGKVLSMFWGRGPVSFKKFIIEIAKKNLRKDHIKCQQAFDKVMITYPQLSMFRSILYKSIFYCYKYTGVNICKWM